MAPRAHESALHVKEEKKKNEREKSWESSGVIVSAGFPYYTVPRACCDAGEAGEPGRCVSAVQSRRCVDSSDGHAGGKADGEKA